MYINNIFIFLEIGLNFMLCVCVCNNYLKEYKIFFIVLLNINGVKTKDGNCTDFSRHSITHFL